MHVPNVMHFSHKTHLLIYYIIQHIGTERSVFYFDTRKIARMAFCATFKIYYSTTRITDRKQISGRVSETASCVGSKIKTKNHGTYQMQYIVHYYNIIYIISYVRNNYAGWIVLCLRSGRLII